MQYNKQSKAIWLCLASIALISCSQDSGSSADTAIELPKTMSIVTAVDPGSLASLTNNKAFGAITTSTFDAGSDYATDSVKSYVYDVAMQPLNTVNTILCLIDQSGADEMLNDGPYYALMDEDKCEQGLNASSVNSNGQSNDGKVIDYNRWTIDATRASGTSPMVVKLWIPGEEGSEVPLEQQKTMVEVTATESVSASKPYGRFTLNFVGVTDYAGFGGSSDNYVATAKGSLKTIDNALDKPQFTLIHLSGISVNDQTDWRWEQFTNAILDDAPGSGGSAKTRSISQWLDNPVEDNNYAVKFNSTHMNRGTDTDADNIANSQVCLSRSNFNTKIWRYNLYHRDAGTFGDLNVTAGQRVALNTGFPFTYNNAGTTVQGYVAYWGLWVENDVNIASGSTIKKVDYSNNSRTDYTVKISNGKLIRRTRNNLSITELVGHKLYYFGQIAGEYNNYIVAVDESYNFLVTHKFTWSNTGQIFTDIDDVTITPTTDGESLWLWADTLGGSLVYTHNVDTETSARSVNFYAREVVNSGDAAISGGLTLTCYARCLKGGISTLAGLTNDSSLYYANDGTAYTYTLTVSAGVMTMTDNTANAGLGAAVDFSGFSATDMQAIMHEWGITTGDMVADNSGITGWRDIYDAPVTYLWETGFNNWNRLVSVVDNSNTVLSFDKPIQLIYTLAAGDDINGDPDTQAGNTFMLSYGGSGSLRGFPLLQSSDGAPGYSSVNLKNGVELTDGEGNVFVVKATEQSQTFQDATGECSSLDTNTVFSDSSLTLPTATDIGSVSFTWGDKPTPVSEAPAFIGGEKQ